MRNLSWLGRSLQKVLPDGHRPLCPVPHRAPLHTGSLVAAVGSWLMAKRAGGKWLLRIDDLDGPRCRQEFEDDILRTLERFELLWDGGITRQSDNGAAYAEAFEQLRRLGAVYPCGCSRAEIARSASAPHPGEEIPYPGTCCNGLATGREPRAWRLRTDGVTVGFTDLRHGRITTELERSGDFIVKRAEGFFCLSTGGGGGRPSDWRQSGGQGG